MYKPVPDGRVVVMIVLTFATISGVVARKPRERRARGRRTGDVCVVCKAFRELDS